jgi:hypothetical protein
MGGDNGQIWTLDTYNNQQLFKQTLETGITAFATYGGQLFWTTSNNNISNGDQLATTVTEVAATVTYAAVPPHSHFVNVVANGTLATLNATTTVAAGHDHAVVNGVIQPPVGYPPHIHVLNGSGAGKVFQYDPATGQVTIIYADSDYALTAISSTSPNDTTGAMFVGSAPHGKIMRYVPADGIFTRSFATPGITVYELRYLNSTMFAVVDNVVYDYTGTIWEFNCSASEIHDVAAESPNVTGSTDIFTLGDTSVSATSTSPLATNQSICCYVRFMDGAGNISAITDANGNLIPCYSPCTNLSTGTSGMSGVSGFSGSVGFFTDQLIEVDESANVVWELAGAQPFLSGNVVQQEVGIYLSEIFNGTDDLVQWTSISWTATTPTGTSITIAVRSADTVADIANALWSDELASPGVPPYGTPNSITDQVGQYLQFRATLTAFEVGVASPTLDAVDIQMMTSEATHYFSTNFVLPANILNGILTFNGCINPPATDLVFGVCGTNSTNFADYYVIQPNQVFTLDPQDQTQNLRVGIKLISSPSVVPIVDEFALAFGLANAAIVRLNLLPAPTTTSGQLAPSSTETTVVTETVQAHDHTVTFDSTILDQFNVNGNSSLAGGHIHPVVNGALQTAASHTHSWMFP